MQVVGSGKLTDCAGNLGPFINQIPDYALFMLDPSGRIMSWNAGAERLNGYSAQEIIGRHFSIFFLAEDLAAEKPRHILEIASREGTYQEEAWRVRKDGTRFWATVTTTALKDEQGKLQGFADLARDFTERKMHEAALHAAREARYRAIYENSHDAIFLTRPHDGVVLAANPAACHLFGYSEQQLLSMDRDDLLDLNDPRFVGAWLERAEAGAVDTELTFIRRDGARFEARVSSKLFTDENGQQLACTNLHDISGRKQTEAALRQSEERFRLLYENAPVGTIQTDQNGYVTSVNQKFLEIAGYSPKDMIGHSHLDLALPEDRSVIEEVANKLRAGEIETFTHERRMLRKDGQTIWVRANARVMPGKQGKPREGLVAYEDITERKQAEAALRQSEERFRLLYENAPLAIIQIDQNGVLISANPKFAEISGYSPEETIGLSRHDVTLPEERALIEKNTKDFLSGRIDTSHYERHLVRKDGSTIWVRQTAQLTRDKQGKPQWGIVVFEDITERKQAEEALQQSEEKFRATFEHVPLGISECTIEGRFLDANPKLLDILGYTKDEFVQLTVKDVTHPGDMEATLSNFQKLAAGEIDEYVIEKRYIRKDRSMVWVNVTATLTPIHGKPNYMVAAIEDISARKKTEAKLKRAMEASYHQANHDMLTGLANRAAFHDRLKEARAYAGRDGHLVAVHLLDLDGFKSINDTLGHHIGDLLLQEVARRIKSYVRATDFSARLGGDEFVVIQTHLAEPAAAAVLAGKLVEELGRTYVLEGQEVHSGTSIGIALYPNDAETPEDLMKHADLALYEAKHRGRFNYRFYRKELGAAFLEAQRLAQELVRALREEEFCLHYQPQFDLKSGRITGIEALLRWHHPTRGMLMAAEFIQDAEHAKLMPAIGEWTLQTACSQHKKWIDLGLAVPLTLNLSSMQLRDPRFLQMLNRILEENGVPAPLLQLEMRENALWDPKLSQSLLAQMKESGLRLALDDFCADMTGLSTLDRFPLDAVKPGQRMMRELPSKKREATILAAIIDIAHNLNMAVCADRIETAGQLAAVKEQDCDSVQGNLLSSPLDPREMTRLIEIEIHA
jgi:diguanylate cyclase (GGDEF)-like protein/PAS domain S-box-containing protein